MHPATVALLQPSVRNGLREHLDSLPHQSELGRRPVPCGIVRAPFHWLLVSAPRSQALPAPRDRQEIVWPTVSADAPLLAVPSSSRCSRLTATPVPDREYRDRCRSWHTEMRPIVAEMTKSYSQARA